MPAGSQESGAEALNRGGEASKTPFVRHGVSNSGMSPGMYKDIYNRLPVTADRWMAMTVRTTWESTPKSGKAVSDANHIPYGDDRLNVPKILDLPRLVG